MVVAVIGLPLIVAALVTFLVVVALGLLTLKLDAILRRRKWARKRLRRPGYVEGAGNLREGPE